MIAQRLILRGFWGIRAGMGVDEIDLDLSQLPEGLIALSGQNGAGKSTILDSLHPYRIMPYKLRKFPNWSVDSFSYYDQTFLSDSKKELFWEMGGRQFRSVILIDAPRRKQECYLYELVSGNWSPALGCDGKARNYDAAIEQICGSPSLFFTSIFRCQGAKNLSDYSRSDILSVISELLNIDHIREQSDKCRAVVSNLAQEATLLRERYATLSESANVAPAYRISIDERNSDVTMATDLLAAAKIDIDAVREELVSARAAAASQESQQVLLDNVRASFAAETKRLVDGKAKLDAVLAGFESRKKQLREVHAGRSSELAVRIERAERIVGGADKIREAVARALVVTADLAGVKVLLPGLEAAVIVADKAVVQWRSKRDALVTELKVAERDADKLVGLGCHGDNSGWLNPTCRFISDAVAARDGLDDLRARLDAIANDTAATEAADAAKVELSSCREKVAALEAELTDLQKYTRLEGELGQSEITLRESREELATVDFRLEEDLRALDNEAFLADGEWLLQSGSINDSIRALEQQLAELQLSDSTDYAARIRELSLREGALLSAITGYEKQIRAAELEVASLQTKLDAALAAETSLVPLRDREAALNSAIARFSLLMKACGNDGIIALELDDAAPSIAGIVNDLLRACYGARFSVRLDTQTAKVGGGLKEAFDIIVFDSETGDERSITEMSGGQITILEDAITRGICLFNIHRSDRVYHTLYSDEKDGALSADRKLEFMKVKREAIRIGTHSREFFISQTAEMMDMADARIVLADGKVCIQ